MDLAVCVGLSLIETALVGWLLTLWGSFLQAFAFFFLLQYAAIKTWKFLIYPFFLSPLRHVPGPTDNHFLVGQEVNKFRAASPNELYLKWMRQWPDEPVIRYLSIGNSEVVLINSLAGHKEALQTKCYSFIKPPFFARLVGELTGKGLLFAEQHEHRKQRRLLNGCFSLPKLKRLLPVFQSGARQLTDSIDKTIVEEEKSAVTEVLPIYSKTTLAVIGVAALGVELENPELATSFHKCCNRLFEQSPLSNIITTVNSFIPIRRWLPIEANLGFVRANAELRGLLQNLIQERIKQVREKNDLDTHDDGTRYRDLLTYMISERLTADDAWTEEDIQGHLLNFVLAGHETTATALAWATHVLCTRPDIQTRLRDEVSELLREKPVPDYADIEKLRYLNNFLREVIRYYSPTVMVPRQAAEDVTIADVMIPKGTSIMMCPSVMNFHPNVWGVDADIFDPDRWDRLTGDATSPFAIQSFIQGPRVCIGRAFALLELKVFLIELVGRWRIAFGPEQNDMVAFENPSLTLRPKGGLKVLFERRRLSE